jgi:hypothetical protein
MVSEVDLANVSSVKTVLTAMANLLHTDDFCLMKPVFHLLCSAETNDELHAMLQNPCFADPITTYILASLDKISNPAIEVLPLEQVRFLCFTAETSLQVLPLCQGKRNKFRSAIVNAVRFFENDKQRRQQHADIDAIVLNLQIIHHFLNQALEVPSEPNHF